MKTNDTSQTERATRRALTVLHRELDACAACPNMIGPVVHGPAIPSKVFLLGQAPGPHEGKHGRPFAWTAGKTLFSWFRDAIEPGRDAAEFEARFRERVYMAAVARCFPGKAAGGGDRRPDREEIARCRSFVEREVQILKPELVLAVGTLAIEAVLGELKPMPKLVDLIGSQHRVAYHGVEVDVIPLPHPSGASPWPRIEPGKTLTARALARVAAHPAMVQAFAK